MLATLILAAAKVDAAVFVVAAVIVLAGALGVVLARNPVHSALMLVMTLFGVAVLFVAQEAHFLAAVQVIVYAGAIVVLFLFVIMLLGVDTSDAIAADALPRQRPLGIALGLLALGEVLLLARLQWKGAGLAAPTNALPGTDVERLGRILFTDYLLPFEATSVLLVIAVVGGVVLARRPSRRDIEREREEAGT
ncbi:MAG TPA: NADH-quinone oxidoreductase subunit J [Acidimicrobiales bacterium]|nr:NADH-quinone oxidoreductase subunit J [Acidimicrobiales bacterium]